MALIHRFAFPGLQPPTDNQSASEPKMKLSTFLFLSLTTQTIALNPAKPLRRQDGPSLLCPVPCDSTWCCLTGQTCQENSNSDIPYACDDPLLQTTEEPFALETFISVISSIESDVVSLGCSLEGVPSGSSCSITVTPLTSYTFETGLPTERPTPRPDNVVSSSTSSAGVGENGRRGGMDGGLLGAGLGMVMGWLV
ncbi:uncharacterized protein PODANS_4_1630 [Podospora anserina S mat+]|uniref:Podospora anserina S mat+ genomic DNA chromosome 4, supercontig 1 n=1 Tax=Podospora anserina (strain S / ATCC MYA-4624 / DSM 980 / FGSC 10383) TaxID=515849 RepID=B2ADP2_PODAN|nr:uncharacterized protein PODANS_4_1630 [Podospora anserina S mat+]CAP61557.1 unnamed protein product [Podospora anserina S mat+]CDP27911.1 Putative protein of unknown function [Podospora anserina S mat+]